MELAIALPIVFLGGLYVASNANRGSSKDKKENFTNLGQKINYLTVQENNPVSTGYVSHFDSTAENYPNSRIQANQSVNNYENSNRASETYFNQYEYEKRENQGKPVSNIIPEIYSLSGKITDVTDFQHNNMVPFYGGKIKGQLYGVNNAQSILDNMNGSGSQMVKKIEQAPLFKPEDSVQWAYGAPNMSDFYQSRVNPAIKNNNIKPFESKNVGPGLDQGYGTEGSGGYNSGMAVRDKWLPKTVDELRVETNPKLEYSLENHEGPAQSHVTNLGIQGKVEKYLPDKFYIQTQDRWFTTTGQEKGETLRPIQEMHLTTRTNTSQSYAGVASAIDKTGSYTPSAFEQSKRLELPGKDIAPSTAVGKAPYNENNHKDCYVSNTNNRTIANQSVGSSAQYGGFSGTIGSVIAPIMDIFKPCRKEEYVSNVRIFGNPSGGDNIPKSYVVNPNDKPSSTIKESTLFSPNVFITNQAEGGNGGYLVASQQPIGNQRETTNYDSYGNVGGAASGYGDMNYSAAYMQTNNDTKELLSSSRTNVGNTQLFNQNMNVSISKVDSDRNNTRMYVPTNMPSKNLPIEYYGETNKATKFTDNKSIDCERMNPDILNAFRANPYTHSLSSVA
jgi:hypothetical protein